MRTIFLTETFNALAVAPEQPIPQRSKNTLNHIFEEWRTEQRLPTPEEIHKAFVNARDYD
jgi:hypothetical protein